MATTAREVASFEGTSLRVIGLDGAGDSELTKAGAPPGGHNTPIWLETGRSVLFCASLGDGHSQPWTVDVETKQVKRLATVSTAVMNARLTPDGKWLYFNSQTGLMRQSLPDGEPETLVAAGSQMPRDVSLSADGRLLIFSQVTDQTMLWRAPLDGKGEPGPFLSEVGVRVTSPAFSPDGSSVAYTLLRRGARMSIQLADVVSGASRPLSSPDVGGFLSSWTANGEVGYMRLSVEGPSYWLQPLKSAGREVPINLEKRNIRRLRISPDGKWITGQFTAPGEKSRVFVGDVETGEARFVTPAGRDISYPVWVPDSKTIAAEERVDGGVSTTLLIASRDGAPVETIVNERVHNWPHDVASDNDTIAFAGLRDGIWNVYSASRKTGKVGRVTNFTSRALLVRYPAISRGKNEVVFEYGESKGNVYVAELQ
jgi:Tol biopolymer transport system component